ncbi:MAG: hypothetical protein OEQ53_15065, partial [Saprospiraceae bacterium]|nr:hypothetical protein [Saprospiraceae bacterium]
MTIDIRVDLPDKIRPMIFYTLDILRRHFDFNYQRVEVDATLTISDRKESDICIAKTFVQAVQTDSFRWQDLMTDGPIIRTEEGKPDYLSTCFYMINCLQDHDTEDVADHLGRFPYVKSYQHAFNCIEQNLVLQYLEDLVESVPAFRNVKRRNIASRIFISHDIDSLLKGIWPELKTAVRKTNLGTVLRLLFIEIWKNQDLKLFNRILSINNEFDVRATFFWMVSHKGFDSPAGKVDNANYRIDGSYAQRMVNFLENNGQHIGLHKSISETSFEQEKRLLKRNVYVN